MKLLLAVPPRSYLIFLPRLGHVCETYVQGKKTCARGEGFITLTSVGAVVCRFAAFILLASSLTPTIYVRSSVLRWLHQI